MAAGSYYRQCRNGIEIFVRLTPRSSGDAVDCVEASADGRSHIKARVRAVPEKGKANQALLRLMADKLGLPASAFAIVSGDTGRLKTVRVTGEPALIEDRLTRLAL